MMKAKVKLIKVNGSKYIEFYGSSSEVANKKHYGGLSDYRSSEEELLELNIEEKSMTQYLIFLVE